MKKIKSNAEIYSVLEDAMTGLTEPITCAELMDRPEVRASAVEKYGSDVQIATNKLSDHLGFMWRRGVLERYPADSSNTRARFAYLWKQVTVPQPKAMPNARSVNNLDGNRRNLDIVDNGDGSVSVHLDNFIINIKHR
jgi:hypothetical protein